MQTAGLRRGLVLVAVVAGLAALAFTLASKSEATHSAFYCDRDNRQCYAACPNTATYGCFVRDAAWWHHPSASKSNAPAQWWATRADCEAAAPAEGTSCEAVAATAAFVNRSVSRPARFLCSKSEHTCETRRCPTTDTGCSEQPSAWLPVRRPTTGAFATFEVCEAYVSKPNGRETHDTMLAYLGYTGPCIEVAPDESSI